MYQISNRQFGEVLEMLRAYVSTAKAGDDLRTQNRYRRARLLIQALTKRKSADNQ